MLETVRLGAGIAAICALGWLATVAIRARENRFSFVEPAVWFLTGTGLLSLFVFWVSLYRSSGGLAAGSLLALAGLLTALASMLKSRGKRFPDSAARHSPHWLPRRRPWFAAGLAAALLLAAFCVALVAFATDPGWDGVAIWGLKARIFFLEGGAFHGYFHDASRNWSHPDYPLLVPLTQAWLYSAMGGIDETLVKGLFLGFYAALLFVFYGGLREKYGFHYSAGFTIVFCLTPLMLAKGTSGYADLPLSAFILGSTVCLYSWYTRRRSQDLVLAGLLSALGIWTKQEGLVIWVLQLAALVAWLGLQGREPLKRRAGEAARFLIPAILLLPWFAFLANAGIQGQDFRPVTAGAFLSHLDRIPTLAKMLLSEVFDTGHWGILWGLFLMGAAYPAPLRLTAGEGFLFFLPAAYLPLITASYVLSGWSNFEAQVVSSIDRLVLHVAPVALFFVAIRLGRVMIEIRQNAVRPDAAD